MVVRLDRSSGRVGPMVVFFFLVRSKLVGVSVQAFLFLFDSAAADSTFYFWQLLIKGTTGYTTPLQSCLKRVHPDTGLSIF